MSTGYKLLRASDEYMDAVSEGDGYFTRVTLRSGKQFCGASYRVSASDTVLRLEGPDEKGERHPVWLDISDIVAVEIEQ